MAKMKPVILITCKPAGFPFGNDFMTNSYHQQAVKACGKDLSGSVTTEDGVFETIEHKTLPIYYVHWHPKRNIGDE